LHKAWDFEAVKPEAQNSFAEKVFWHFKWFFYTHVKKVVLVPTAQSAINARKWVILWKIWSGFVIDKAGVSR
jgi:hypothetical protein